MYSKKDSNKFKETQLDLDNYMGTLKKTAQHFPKEVVSEFDKVLFDLMRVSKEESKYSKDYKFSKSYNSSHEFNFELLEKYLLNFETPIIVPSSNRVN